MLFFVTKNIIFATHVEICQKPTRRQLAILESQQ